LEESPQFAKDRLSRTGQRLKAAEAAQQETRSGWRSLPALAWGELLGAENRRPRAWDQLVN
jgi:hypothetical protein